MPDGLTPSQTIGPFYFGTLVKAYADVKAVAPEVAEQAVGALERGRRYLQDVY